VSKKLFTKSEKLLGVIEKFCRRSWFGGKCGGIYGGIYGGAFVGTDT